MYVKIPKNKITRMEIVMTDCELTLQQVIQKYKCRYAINGGLYNMKTGEPNAIPLRVNGKTIATSSDGYWMMAWNEGPDLCMIHSRDINKWKWAIACATMIKGGQNTYFTYAPAQGGTRGRTGFGDNDTEAILYCTTDRKDPMTPVQLRTNMKNIGALNAIMLDCGGSSQMYNNGTYLQAEKRKVAYWICVWTNEEDKIIPIEECPFREPQITIRYGTRGEGAKWVQWYLNKVDNANLVVDGIFGNASRVALAMYQKKKGLVMDALCGKNTRNALKKDYGR